MKKECILVALLGITSHLLFAQVQLRFRNYSTRDGLSHNQVNCLMSDSRGFLWIGTTFGLNRFDGVTFEKWFHIPEDSTSLIGNGIYNLMQDRHENIWISTEEGISIYHVHTGKFRSIRKIQTVNSGVIALNQATMFCDSDGDIWIGSGIGSVILYKHKEDKYYNIPVALRPPGVIQNEFVSEILEDRKHRIWVSTSNGIYQIDKQQLSAIAYWDPSQKSPLRHSNTQMMETTNGQLLCGSWTAGYFIYNEAASNFQPAFSFPDFSTLGQTILNFGQHKNNIFISSGIGLFRCSENEIGIENFNSFQKLETGSSDLTGIASTSVNDFLSDQSGHFWLGGNNGLALLNDNYEYYQSYSFTGLTDFASEHPRSIYQKEDQLLVGIGNNLLIFDLKSERFYTQPVSIEKVGFYQFIVSGEHLYQPSLTGLIIYDKLFNVEKRITKINPAGKLLNCYTAMEDRDGNVWMATSRNGMRKLGTDGYFHYFLHDPNSPVNSLGDLIGDLEEGKDGTIYAGGKNLFILKRNSTDFIGVSILKEEKSNEIRALKFRDSLLWIGSRNGLFSYSEKNGSVRHYRLPADVNQTIEVLEFDYLGNAWMVTSSGLVRYNPFDSTTIVFNERNGWPSSYSAIQSLDNHKMAVGCIGEIVLLDPAAVKTEPQLPKPFITQISIDENNTYLMPATDTTFRLKFKQSIRFQYISLNYRTATFNKYAWQLKGLDDRWHNTGTITNQPFASLAPGDYTFNVKSVNANNIWSEMASVHFKIMPPFYRTAWFILGAILLISGMIYWLYCYRLQKAIQIERLRTRIATDLHDDIGATLSSISFYSEAVHQKTKNKLPEVSPILEKMGETSRGMVSSMSDIVWAINPQNDDMNKMLQRMTSYVNELTTLTGKSIAIHVDHKAHDLKLQLEQRKNIYLIFKEALNNALKYADSHQIQVDVCVHGNALHLKIADDGKGFDLQAETEGNGIRNMQRRAEEIGGQLLIRSGADKGTAVELNAVIS